jgi:hypothetical protein
VTSWVSSVDVTSALFCLCCTEHCAFKVSDVVQLPTLYISALVERALSTSRHGFSTPARRYNSVYEVGGGFLSVLDTVVRRKMSAIFAAVVQAVA